MSQAAPAPTPSEGPGSPFTVASWVVLAGGLLAAFFLYDFGVTRHQPGALAPGFREALLGIAVTAVGCFGCSLTALLRRERRRWQALLPFLAGLGMILLFACSLIRALS